MKAVLRRVRISPKKMNVIAGMVRSKSVADAREILELTHKKAAKILLKVLNSAVANASKNFKQKEDTLTIKEILVTKGPVYARSLPISRGRAHPIMKRTTHITLSMTAAAEPEKKAKSVKQETAEKKKETADKPKEAETPKEKTAKKEEKADTAEEKKTESAQEKTT